MTRAAGRRYAADAVSTAGNAGRPAALCVNARSVLRYSPWTPCWSSWPAWPAWGCV